MCPSGWIFESTSDYNVCFTVSGGFLLLAGLISCLVDVIKRRREAKAEVIIARKNAFQLIIILSI